MIRTLPMLLMLIVMPVLACSERPGGMSAQEQMPQNQQGYPAQPQQEQSLQIAEGELARVDSQNQAIWLKTADGREAEFSYNAQTQVEGAGGSVEGLANMAGTKLRVHFQSAGDKKVAAKIEVLAATG